MQAKLSTANSADYFVYWRDASGRLHKKRAGMNRIQSLRDRKVFGRQLCARINQLLSGEFAFKRPVGEVLHEINNRRKGQMELRGWQSYGYAVNKFDTWLREGNNNQSVFMEDVTNQTAHSFIDYLHEKNYSGYTINNIRGNLRALFSLYGKGEEFYRNPFKGTQKARCAIGRNLAFNDQQRELLTASLSEDMLFYIRIIYYTYLRPIEILRLKIQDIRLDLGKIILTGKRSKNRKQGAVTIPQSFIDEFKSRGLQQYPADWYLFSRGLKPGPSPHGRGSVTLEHGKTLKKLGFGPEYTMYSWKHTGVVNAYKAGINLHQIMLQLRHSSLDMTQIYLKTLGLEENTEFRTKMV